jgi:hypothetical protein
MLSISRFKLKSLYEDFLLRRGYQPGTAVKGEPHRPTQASDSIISLLTEGCQPGLQLKSFGHQAREKETLIIVVTSNPKPRNRVSFKNANGTITPAYSYRPNIFLMVDAFETQRRVERVLRP